MNNTKSRFSAKPQQRRNGRGNSARSTESTAASRPQIVPSDTNSSLSNDDNACVVCFKNFEIYSIGDCDHPVCYECSTRMRVLCQQNECPICRHVMSKVLFTLDKLPYRELEANNRSDFYCKKYGIGFSTADIQKKFSQLLDHPCPKCEAPPFHNFEALRSHVRRDHNLYYCDLCVENLNIFTFERKCYTHSELHLHNTKGDMDNRSHRGHPLCEYCKKRYVDRDELFRHLRREHYFCYFCDADGCNEFYNDYADLAEHFRKEHFLCEEGKCATEQFVGAFRNEIEYKAHVASVHGKSLNKHQAKQTRTLQLEITLGPRGRSGQTEQGIANMRSRNDEHNNYMEELPSSNSQRGPSVSIDAGNEDEFPLLGGTTTGPNVSLVRPPPPSMRNLSGSSGLARTKENFPALGGGVPGGSSNGNAAKSGQPVSAVFKKPTGSSRGNAPANGMLLHVSNRPSTNSAKKSSDQDFPALSGGKGKKQARNLEEDMLPSNSGVSMSNLSAKHRTLVDDYVSVANPTNFHKFQMVQKEELEAKMRQEAQKKSAPKLTTVDFPSLGPSSNKTSSARQNNAATALNWTKPISDKKQQELQNRKSKVAPAPMLPTFKGNNNQDQQQNNKKDKKSKDKKSNQENQPKVNGSKQKEKNNNNNEQKQVVSPQAKMSSSSENQLQPPPGFMSNVTVNSVAKLPNNLTFTTSSGESYNIVPSTHVYSDPPDAANRNQNLVDYFRDVLKTPEALNEFRELSLKFREGACHGQAYYEHCQSAMHDKFNKIFPELLAMLPDISKQQELYLVHKQHLNTLSPAQRKSIPNLEVCGICKQILLENDMSSHQKVHALKNSFPELGNAKSNPILRGSNKNAQRK